MSRGILTTHGAAGSLWNECIRTVGRSTHPSLPHISTTPHMILQTGETQSVREREEVGRTHFSAKQVSL